MPSRDEILQLMEGEEFDRRDEIIVMGDAAIPALVDIVNSAPDFLVRLRAVVLLGEVGNTSVRPVLEEFLRDEHPVMRLNAARALSQIAGVGAVPALVSLLNDADTGVSNAAIECLGRVGNSEALASLESLRATSPHDFLKSQAEMAIKNIQERLA